MTITLPKHVAQFCHPERLDALVIVEVILIRDGSCHILTDGHDLRQTVRVRRVKTDLVDSGWVKTSEALCPVIHSVRGVVELLLLAIAVYLDVQYSDGERRLNGVGAGRCLQSPGYPYGTTIGCYTSDLKSTRTFCVERERERERER